MIHWILVYAAGLASTGSVWSPAFETEKGVVYINVDDIQSDSMGKHFWTKTVLAEPTSDGIGYFLTKQVLNCERQTLMVEHVVGYSLDGRPLGSENVYEPAKPIAPGTNGTKFTDLICLSK